MLFLINPTTAALTPSVSSVTAMAVFTGTSGNAQSMQAAISTSSSAPVSYAGRASIPCFGCAFSAVSTSTVNETITRVLALTASQNIYFLMTENFSSGTMNASSSPGMSATRIG